MDQAIEEDDGARIDAIAAEIAAERRRQVARWGRQDHPSIGPAGTEPFGAVVVKDGRIVGEGLNHARAHHDPVVVVDRAAQQLVAHGAAHHVDLHPASLDK